MKSTQMNSSLMSRYRRVHGVTHQIHIGGFQMAVLTLDARSGALVVRPLAAILTRSRFRQIWTVVHFFLLTSCRLYFGMCTLCVRSRHLAPLQGALARPRIRTGMMLVAALPVSRTLHVSGTITLLRIPRLTLRRSRPYRRSAGHGV